MPELPEVETVRRDLTKLIVKKKIFNFEVTPDFEKKITPDLKTFKAAIVGKRLKRINRRGKLLIFDFGKEIKVQIHLKMTGQLIFWSPKRGILQQGGHPLKAGASGESRFTRATFYFQAGEKLFFNDLRKFGFIRLVDNNENRLILKQYGWEPVDAGFDYKTFEQLLTQKPALEIKKLLLQQNLIAGIGNIYADESCFSAGLRGDRKINSLSKQEKKKLFYSLKRILKNAIKHRGTSVNTYVGGTGQKGNYARFLKVYQRAGRLCLKCRKETIKKIKFAGRGTSFCPYCQK